MTRAEILDCLTDRPCECCKFHESGRCERWDCVFEEKPDNAEPCEDDDAISRQAVLDELEKWDWQELYLPIHFKQILDELPSVTPKQKVGKWIYTKAVSTGEIIWSECSVCGEGEHGCAKRMKFCPNCGVKMAESEDTE